MYLFEWISVTWLSSYGLLFLCAFDVQFITTGLDLENYKFGAAKTSKRSSLLLNITAPEYLIDGKKAMRVTVSEMTDYACGASRLCHPENSFFNYAALCFKCEPCRCDEMCRYHGDCCNDVLVNNSLPLMGVVQSPHVSCVSKLEDDKIVKKKRPPGLLMVTRCPGTSYRNESSVARMCENPDLSNLEQAIPVWSSARRVAYRNQFCANCHGLTTGYEFWRVSAMCNHSSLFNGASSKNDVWKTMWQSEDCSLNVTAPPYAVNRACQLDLVSSCGKDGKQTSGIVERMCAQFTSAVRYGNTWYKNVFCAVCNGAKLDRGKICRAPEIHSRKPPVPPLSVLLDFYPKSDPKPTYPGELRQCSHHQIYNPLLERCQKVYCPHRRFYNGKSCEKIFETITGLGYELSYSMKTTEDLFISNPNSILRRYERKLRRRFGQFEPYALVPMKMALLGRRHNEESASKRNRVSSLEVFVRFVSSCNVSLDRLEEELLTLQHEPWTFVKGDIRSRFVPDGFAVARQRYSTVEKTEEVGVISKSDSTRVFGKSCKGKDCLQDVRFISVKGQLLCPFVEINTTQLQSNLSYRNSSIASLDYTVSLNNSNHRHSGDIIQICVSVLSTLHHQQIADDPDEAEKYPKAIISTICLALSVCCLVMTFIVYCLLPSLQTLPGKNTMALVFHLFMAQLLFLSGSGATSNTNVCRVLAITIHYFWLASFSWMFICAYHMYSIFSNLVDNTKDVTRLRNERRKFIHYALFANLSSLILVVICVVYFLCRTGGAGIGYGGDVCFLINVDAIVIFFAAPLLLVLIFNCFFFIRTVISIRRTPNVGTANSSNRNYVAIYFRLSILLGFGWIFGFLPQTFVIFCIFTVLTAGQGIFIFLSFCANKRIWKMLRQRVHGEKPTCAYKLTTGNSNSTETASV